MPGAFPSTPTSTELKANRVLGRNPGDEDKIDSAFQSQSQLPFPRELSAAALPTSPPYLSGGGPGAASRRSSINTAGRKGGSSMRRLFSFRSLYSNSNGSSTDCFSGGDGSGGAYTGSSLHLQYDPTQPNRLARMSSSDSFAAAYRRPASSMGGSLRPESRMTNATGGSNYNNSNSNNGGGKSPGAQQQQKKKRNSAFFGSGSGRRKSGLFLFGGARVDENGMIPEDGAAEAEKENIEPPPTIQEVKVDTSIGGEELFRDIK